MKKFISVLLAILMVVAVMPFAIFAAEEGYVREKNTAHVCHPVDKDGNLILDAVDMADATVAFTKAATDTQVVEKYLTDGDKATATRLPVGTTAKLTITFAEAKDLGTLTLTVNGKGKINPGETFESEVIADSKHNLKVKVVAYKGTTKVYEDTAEVDTTEVKDLVVNIFEKADKIEITTVGAAKADKGGPRLWEISATTVKGEAEYVHDYERVITKLPSLYVDETVNGEGKATDTCKNCGHQVKDIVLPAITKEELNGGKVTLDDIASFEEKLTQKNPDGSVKTDDDGNEYFIDADIGRKPEALFDNDYSTGGAWNVGGSYWNARNGGQLVITMKRDIEISYFKYLAWGSWMAVNFEFYKGDTLVAAVNGGANEKWGCWVVDDGIDKWYDVTSYTVTKPKETNPLDYITAPDEHGNPVIKSLEGVVFNKIVITMVNTKDAQRAKIGELEIGIHQHVYAESDVKAGTHGTGADVCKWTHTSACLECHEVVKDAVTYLHTIETEVKRESSCGNGIAIDTCKAEGCEYTTGEYTVAGTGEHDYSTYVVQAKRANCGAAGTAYFTCATCKEREVIPNVTFKQSESEKAQEAFLAIVANLAGKMLAQDVVADGITIATKYNKDKKNFFTEEQAMVALDAGVTEFYFSCTDAQTGEAVTIKYAIAISGSIDAEKPEDSTYTISVKVGEAPKGLHTMGTKNIVPSTYTVHGEDYAYCTVCGTEFKDIRSEAALKAIGTGVYVRNNGFTLRTSEYEGIRLTMTINKDVIKSLFADYSVRIWVVATNSVGETSEMQVYGAGAKNLISNNGKFSVVVKDFAHDRENIKFQLKISVKDANGEQVEYRDIGTTSLAKVREAGV